MFKINDYVIYDIYGVCKILDIEINEKTEKKFYILKPLHQNLTIKTLVNNDQVSMRKILSKDEVKTLIDDMPEVEPIWIKDVKQRRKKFKELLKTGRCRDLLRVIKTIYLKTKERKNQGQKITVTDKEILETAKKQLYDEFSFVLNIPIKQVESYILARL